MAIRSIVVAASGRGPLSYRLQQGEAFTVRTATWRHTVIVDPFFFYRTWPEVILRAQDGRVIAVAQAPSFNQIGTYEIRFGGVQPWPGSAVGADAIPTGEPMVGSLPDVLLSPGCVVECGAGGDLGGIRPGDLVADLVLTVSDAVSRELAVS